MKIKLLNVVLFAEQYEALIDWYQEALHLEKLTEEKGEYHYTELGFDQQAIVGITPANEIKHQPTTPRNNASVMQLEVSEIHQLFIHVKEKGGKILFGPTADEKYSFHYGGIADIEGNQIWIVEGS